MYHHQQQQQQHGGGGMSAALRDGAGGAVGHNPGSNIGVDRTGMFTPRLNTAGQQQVYGQSGGGYGSYPSPQVQQESQSPHSSRLNVQNAGGVDGNYGSARIQTARSRMLGGSAMSNIMTSPQNQSQPSHSRGRRSHGRNQDVGGGSAPYGTGSGMGAVMDQSSFGRAGASAQAPQTARSAKSQYALDLEQQMREKQARDQKMRDLDRADGIGRSGGGRGRASRVVSNLRNTVQESRTMTQDDESAGAVNASRQRMLGGGAMAGMLGGGGSDPEPRNIRNRVGNGSGNSPSHQQQLTQPQSTVQPGYGDPSPGNGAAYSQPRANQFGEQPSFSTAPPVSSLGPGPAAPVGGPSVQVLMAENTSLRAELHAMQALLEQYYSRFGPLPAQ